MIDSAGGGFTRTGICTVVDMRSLEIAEIGDLKLDDLLKIDAASQSANSEIILQSWQSDFRNQSQNLKS